MQLLDVQCFLLAAELGTVTHAAEQLNRAQPAASVAISRLEAQLGVQLLERHSTGVRPTPAGKEFSRHAQMILNCVDRAEREMAAFREGSGGAVRGHVDLGVAPSLTPVLLSRLLRAAHRSEPEVTIQPTEDLTRDLLERLEALELDLVLLWLPAGLPSSLRVHAVGSTRLSVVMAVDHPLATHETVSLDELRDEVWIAFPSANPARQWIDGSCLRAGFAPRIEHEIEALTEIKAFVEAGIGVTLLPRASVAAEEAAGALKAVSLPEPVPRAIFGYAHDPTRDESVAVAALRHTIEDELRDAMQDEPDQFPLRD